jgi:hypothetical protein
VSELPEQIESERQKDITTVIKEKNLLMVTCRLLSDLIPSKFIKDVKEMEENKPREINRLLIDISTHLSNIGGFCDERSRKSISAVVKFLSVVMITPMAYLQLKSLLPIISGLEVNFNKRPFKIIKFSIPGIINTEFKRE